MSVIEPCVQLNGNESNFPVVILIGTTDNDKYIIDLHIFKYTVYCVIASSLSVKVLLFEKNLIYSKQRYL